MAEALPYRIDEQEPVSVVEEADSAEILLPPAAPAIVEPSTVGLTKAAVYIILAMGVGSLAAANWASRILLFGLFRLTGVTTAPQRVKLALIVIIVLVLAGMWLMCGALLAYGINLLLPRQISFSIDRRGVTCHCRRGAFRFRTHVAHETVEYIRVGLTRPMPTADVWQRNRALCNIRFFRGHRRDRVLRHVPYTTAIAASRALAGQLARLSGRKALEIVDLVNYDALQADVEAVSDHVPYQVSHHDGEMVIDIRHDRRKSLSKSFAFQLHRYSVLVVGLVLGLSLSFPQIRAMVAARNPGALPSLQVLAVCLLGASVLMILIPRFERIVLRVGPEELRLTRCFLGISSTRRWPRAVIQAIRVAQPLAKPYGLELVMAKGPPISLLNIDVAHMRHIAALMRRELQVPASLAGVNLNRPDWQRQDMPEPDDSPLKVVRENGGLHGYRHRRGYSGSLIGWALVGLVLSVGPAMALPEVIPHLPARDAIAGFIVISSVLTLVGLSILSLVWEAANYAFQFHVTTEKVVVLRRSLLGVCRREWPRSRIAAVAIEPAFVLGSPSGKAMACAALMIQTWDGEQTKVLLGPTPVIGYVATLLRQELGVEASIAVR